MGNISSQMRVVWVLFESAGTALSRISLFALLLGSVPFLTEVLDSSSLALWLILGGLLNAFLLFDFGVSSVALNQVSILGGNCSERRRVISAAVILTVIAGVMVGLVFGIFYYCMRQYFFPASIVFQEEFQGCVLIFLAMYWSFLTLNTLFKIFLGCGLVRVYSAISIPLNLVMLFVIVGMCYSGVSDLAFYIVTLFVGFFLGVCLCIFYLVRLQYISISGWWSQWIFFFNQGKSFFLLQCGGLFGWGLDGLILSWFVKAEVVVAYLLVQRGTQLISQPLGIIGAHFWPHYSRAFSNGEPAKQVIAMHFSLVASFLFLGILGVATLYSIFSALLEQKGVSIALLIAFFMWVCTEAIGGAFSVYMNAFRIFKPQLLLSCAMVAFLPVKIWVLMQFDEVNMLMAFVGFYVLVSVYLYLYRYRSLVIAGIVCER